MNDQWWELVDLATFLVGYQYEHVASWDVWDKVRVPDRILNQFRAGQGQYHEQTLRSHWNSEATRNELDRMLDQYNIDREVRWPRPPDAAE
jgi:hypothetical protein